MPVCFAIRANILARSLHCRETRKRNPESRSGSTCDATPTDASIATQRSAAPRTRGAPSSRATASRSNSEGDRLGSSLELFETFSQDSKCEDLCLGHGVIRRVAVRKHSRQLRHFRKPPAVVLALAFKIELHGVTHSTRHTAVWLTRGQQRRGERDARERARDRPHDVRADQRRTPAELPAREERGRLGRS